MARDCFPWRDGEWVTYSANFGAKIVGSPEVYGISPERAAGYVVLAEAFADAYQRAVSPSTNSGTAKEAMRAAREALEDETRLIGRIIRARPNVTSDMRLSLRMNPRNGGGKSPRIPAPDKAPIVEVVAVVGRTVKIRLINRQSPTRRGKPRGIRGATIWTYIGEDPPATLKGWRCVGITTLTTVDIPFEDPTLPPGTKVWVTAWWENPRGEIGPGAEPVYAWLQGGVIAAA